MDLAGLLQAVFPQAEAAEIKSNPLEKLANSSQEYAIINKVADEYKLDDTQRKLLYSIRKVENGRQGREFGVLSPEAMRYEKGDPLLSLETQAKWAAGTIKKRFNGNLEEFAGRWAPVGAKNDPTNLNKNWIKNIKFYMEQK